MKARLKFIKTGHMKFIGHLDFLRLFQRCIRRAHLPIEYSKGFNPHQHLFFALPLALGASSEGEYVDVGLEDEIETREIKNRLNKVLPEGIEIQDVCVLTQDMPIGMAAVDAAKYKVFIDKDKELQNFLQECHYFINQSEVIVEKKGKKGNNIINVKDMIYEYSIDQTEIQWIIYLFLATGSKKNLKPETIMKQLYKNNGWDYKDYKIQIHRINIFSKIDNEFVPLLY